MSTDAQVAEDQPQQLPVATFKPAADGNVEQIWQGIERSYRISREHNRQILRDHVGATTAAALTFSNQLLHVALLNPGPETEFADDEDEGLSENPTQPGPPQPQE